MSKKKYTEAHLHEALDRTSNVLDIVDRQLVSHKVYKKNKKYKKRINRVADALAELYQLIGAEMFESSEVLGTPDAIPLATLESKSQLLQDHAQECSLPVTDVKLAPADPIGTDDPAAPLQSVVIHSVNATFPEYLAGSVVRQLSDSMFICRLTPEQYLVAIADVSLHVADYSI